MPTSSTSTSSQPSPTNNPEPQPPSDGSCGPPLNRPCPEFTCCSKYGFCGTTPDHVSPLILICLKLFRFSVLFLVCISARMLQSFNFAN
jgi:hypothetical protein